MHEFIGPAANWCAAVIEILGIGVITAIAVFAPVNAAVRLLKGAAKEAVYHEMRQFLGRGILLGLEFLIAADIIFTVAVDLNWETISALAMIIVLRTFLSFTLEVELSGKWPWQDRH